MAGCARGVRCLRDGSIPTLKDRRAVTPSDQNQPAAYAWFPQRALQLIDLTGPGAVRLGASHKINSGPKGVTRRWARAIRAAWPDADGLLCASSMTGEEAVTLWAPAQETFAPAPAFASLSARPSPPGVKPSRTRADSSATTGSPTYSVGLVDDDRLGAVKVTGRQPVGKAVEGERTGGTAATPQAPAGHKVGTREAARILANRDPVLGRLVTQVGPPRIGRPTGSHFAVLVRSVTYQQLAGAAAAAIHGRLVATLGGEVSPERLLATPPEALRAAGLSANKLASLVDLATKVVDGTVILDSRGLARESDEEIIARLSTVRGIARWTAQIFLMFQLRRPDVWPTGDLGVRKGYGLAWGVPVPTPRELEALGDPYRPYRSVVAWYCWRATELYAGAETSAVTA